MFSSVVRPFHRCRRSILRFFHVLFGDKTATEYAKISQTCNAYNIYVYVYASAFRTFTKKCTRSRPSSNKINAFALTLLFYYLFFFFNNTFASAFFEKKKKNRTTAARRTTATARRGFKTDVQSDVYDREEKKTNDRTERERRVGVIADPRYVDDTRRSVGVTREAVNAARVP